MKINSFFFDFIGVGFVLLVRVFIQYIHVDT